MGITIHGAVEEPECGGRLEVEGGDVMELIQIGIGDTCGEVRRYNLHSSVWF